KIILQRLGIQLQTHPKAGCCGAVSHHLSAEEEALNAVKHNIDVWWPLIENGAEAIVVTASGCGAMVKDYADLLADNPDYADKAKRVSQLAKDISEILANEDINQIIPATDRKYQHVAFHSPCTLQHGQKLTGIVESILTQLGYTLTHVADSHLCCGSAGTYSFLQPALSQKLLDNKLKSLTSGPAEVIVTANIGCQMHMASKAQVPVKHWVELLV
ncbi:MAG: heterodisulfide reductase-related iron-sulfur binding cluster, partial [Gammaproteobacteria bacterium]|nr:heterodisulfide reductase-related iron-sulfur binding cluster [Gammaproteobacteria bacterium]